ncbi:MAG: DUF3267 domain-containing protein [Bacteroidales bacterium]|nr:DUF3267 domain-containing protein [Bacteroidales bacterium]
MEEFKNKRKITIDVVKANVFAVVIMFAAAVVFFVPYFLLWRENFSIQKLSALDFKPLLFLCIFITVGIVVHELIHGITFAYFAKSGWKSIKFGVMWKMLTPYCHCSEPLRKNEYILVSLMPCIILGIIPAVAALFVGSFALLFFGIVFIGAAAGDIWVSRLLIKEKSDCTVLDNPSEIGFYVIEA